jgi:RimJ/RimL family protein N-acetyltransferase
MRPVLWRTKGDHLPTPPARIVADGLVLAAWYEAAAPLLKEAIDRSLPELQRWMVWAPKEPQPLDELRERMAQRNQAFIEGRDFYYLIFNVSEDEVLGSIGLHPGARMDEMEIGYWVRSDRAGQGVATAAARALTLAAFAEGVVRIEIRCDPANQASAAIPKRLGYRLVEVLPQDVAMPGGDLRDTMVWERTLAQHVSG